MEHWAVATIYLQQKYKDTLSARRLTNKSENQGRPVRLTPCDLEQKKTDEKHHSHEAVFDSSIVLSWQYLNRKIKEIQFAFSI